MQLSNYEAGKNNRATNISRYVFQMGFLNYGYISELNILIHFNKNVVENQCYITNHKKYANNSSILVS